MVLVGLSKFATGMSYKWLSTCFGLGKSTVIRIVDKFATAIWPERAAGEPHRHGQDPLPAVRHLGMASQPGARLDRQPGVPSRLLAPGPDRGNDLLSLSPLEVGVRLTLLPRGEGALSQPGDADAPGGKKKLPTIVYASQTHSQLHQVVCELNATQYRWRSLLLPSSTF
eukprot:jgi/Mesen1/2649/ME000166S01771